MKKIVIIVLVVIMVGVVAMLVATSGGGRGTADPKPSFVTRIGSLAPHTDVVPGDLTGSACFESATKEFVVSAGASCQVRLPSRATRIRLCLAEGIPQRVRIKGRDYGPQDADLADLGCAAGDSFSLYDTGSILIIVGPPLGGTCKLRLLGG